MRITNSMLVKDMLWNANNNLVSMSNYQNQLSTGKRITRPSDDPEIGRASCRETL